MKTVKIVDYFGKKHFVPVDDSVYEVITGTEFNEERQDKKSYRHRGVEQDGEYANPEDYADADSIDDLVDVIVEQEERKALYDAITKLTPIQRRRVYMYMKNMSYVDIARAEGRDASVIRRSMLGSFKRLRRILTETR